MESKNTCVEVFGKRLKELRKANGYTIEQFAEAVGISKSTVGYYENNNRMPDIEILSRIADVLNVSADYLIGKTNTTATKGKLKQSATSQDCPTPPLSIYPSLSRTGTMANCP